MAEIDALAAISAVSAPFAAITPPAMLGAGEVNGASGVTGTTGTTGMTGANGANSFSTWFAQELQASNGRLAVAEKDIALLASGQAPSLHQVMIHMEEAKLSLQLLAQVRNRLLDAYQEVMRMQV